MNEELKRLQEKRAQIADAMAKMVEVAEKEDRGLSDEERGKWNSARAELESTDNRMNDVKEAEALRQSVNVPSNPLPVENREYELDDFGNPIRPKRNVKNNREDREQEYTDAFIALIRSEQPGMVGLDNKQIKTLKSHCVTEEVRAQGVMPKTSGGFLVPVTLANNITETMKAFGGIRQFSTVLNTSAGEEVNYPTNDDTGNMGELVAEHAQSKETDFEFGQKKLGAYKYSSKVVRVSIELLQDSSFALDSFITRKFGERLGRITAKHYATGTGNNQPTGLLKAASVGHIAGSQTDIEYNDLLVLKHSVDPAYRNMGQCRWVFNDKGLLYLKEMVDNEGRPLWKPSIAEGSPDLIDGDPYIIDQGCPDPKADSTPLAYGDLSEYIIRDVLGFTLHRMVEKYIDYGQIGFLAFMRTDANLMDTEAVKTLKMKGGGGNDVTGVNATPDNVKLNT